MKRREREIVTIVSGRASGEHVAGLAEEEEHVHLSKEGRKKLVG